MIVMSSFTGEVMSKTKVGGEWMYKISYNDDDSEEFTRCELVKQIERVNHSDNDSDDNSECDESDSD